ncbi:MAG: hypothetical protein QOI23_1357 [Chloroflexota bacterium]|nr:hypothetical protein [Chloroflexota bacterium]
MLLLASGLNVPDDLLFLRGDGAVLVGEHGSGHIARVTSRGVTRLPQVIPEVEGIAQIGDTVYVADQFHSRVVALTATGVHTVLQLQLDPNGLNLDGIDSNGTQLIVPDSPHGTVLFVNPAGHVTARQSGFSRPAGVWAQSAPYLIADENASAVFALKSGGGFTTLAGNLPGVDDVVRDPHGHVIVTLPGQGILRDVTSGVNVASGLRNPQGLGFDGAQNLLVTESDAGRLDLLVKTFAVQVPTPAVRLQPGQGVCLGILRAPGFTEALKIEQLTGANVATEPGSSSSLEVVPWQCAAATCTVVALVSGAVGGQVVSYTYRD